MPVIDFRDNSEVSRYELRHDGVLVSVLDYRDNGETRSLVRAFTVPTHRGRGHAAEVTELAVAELESRGDRRVLPVCWYVAEWFEAHPDRAGILATT